MKTKIRTSTATATATSTVLDHGRKSPWMFEKGYDKEWIDWISIKMDDSIVAKKARKALEDKEAAEDANVAVAAVAQMQAENAANDDQPIPKRRKGNPKTKANPKPKPKARGRPNELFVPVVWLDDLVSLISPCSDPTLQALAAAVSLEFAWNSSVTVGTKVRDQCTLTHEHGHVTCSSDCVSCVGSLSILTHVTQHNNWYCAALLTHRLQSVQDSLHNSQFKIFKFASK